jgi:hypothetical protein
LDPPETSAKASISLSSDLKSFLKQNTQTFSNLPEAFWLLCVIVMCIYGTIIPFNNIVSEFLQVKWYQNDPEIAGKIMG